jgi:hypothetical protein
MGQLVLQSEQKPDDCVGSQPAKDQRDAHAQDNTYWRFIHMHLMHNVLPPLLDGGERTFDANHIVSLSLLHRTPTVFTPLLDGANRLTWHGLQYCIECAKHDQQPTTPGV